MVQADDPEAGSTRWRGLELAHDSIDRPLRDRGIVLGPSPTTDTLAAQRLASRGGRALDIGTGCGALALLLAEQADAVVGTDVNPRALRFAERNAQRNGITAVQFREGDLFEPVRGERFDLVLGNLPFVLGSTRQFMFRDGVPGDDDICRRAVEGSPGVLTDGGTAQFLVNWPVEGERRPFDEPINWFRTAEAGGLILLHSVVSPARYAQQWSAAERSHDRAAHDLHVREWADRLIDSGCVGVANGIVSVTIGGPIRTARMNCRPTGRGGRQIERILYPSAPVDERHEDRPRLVRPHTITTVTETRDDNDVRRSAAVRLADSCGVAVAIPDDLSDAVARLDGKTQPRLLVGAKDVSRLLTTITRLRALGFVDDR